jgi:hypothetical protein
LKMYLELSKELSKRKDVAWVCLYMIGRGHRSLRGWLAKAKAFAAEMVIL